MELAWQLIGTHEARQFSSCSPTFLASTAADTVLLPVTIPMALLGGDSPGSPSVSVAVDLPVFDGEVFVADDATQACVGWLTAEGDETAARAIVVTRDHDPAFSSAEAQTLSADTLRRFPQLERQVRARGLRFNAKFWPGGAGPTPGWTAAEAPVIRVFDAESALVFIAGDGKDAGKDEVDGVDVRTARDAVPHTRTRSVDLAGRRQWEALVPLSEDQRHRSIVTPLAWEGENCLLLAALPGLGLILDRDSGAVKTDVPALGDFGAGDAQLSELDVFALDADQNLLARGERRRGVVHVTALHHPHEAPVNMLEVPWGLRAFWRVERLRFDADKTLVVEFSASGSRLFATVIYSLPEARVLWSEARRRIDSVVLSPDARWLVYLKDRDRLEIVQLQEDAPISAASGDVESLAITQPCSHRL